MFTKNSRKSELKCIPIKEQDDEVKITQKWDGKRQERTDDIEELKRREKRNARFHMIVTSQNQPTSIIKWIEKGILENPLPDHRKYIIWRILSPYLLNVKKLQKEESYSIIKDWLDKCNNLEKLKFNAKIKIKEGIKGASKVTFQLVSRKQTVVRRNNK